MSENKGNIPADGREKTLAQLDELCWRVAVVENFFKDLSPAFGKISKEVTPTLNTLRAKYERDETLTLIDKIGDHIPTFIGMLDLMEGLQGFLRDFLPAVERMNREVLPTVNALRTSLEKGELVDLVVKAGENLSAFHALLDLLSLPETGALIRALEKGIARSVGELEGKPPVSNLRHLISVLGDPDTHKALLFLVLLARNVYGGLKEEKF